MKLNIIEQAAAKMRDKIMEALNDESSTAYFYIDTPAGWIDIETDKDDNIAVIAGHNNGNEGLCPRLCEAIADALPTWKDVREEWAQECKSYRTDGLDPAFRDWNDYWHYIGLR